MTKAIFIDGEAGTTGLGIRERLAGVTDIRILSIDPARRKDPEARRAMMIEADLVVLCLPDAAAKESAALAASLGADAPRLLDASTAHRCDPAWAFGFPELEFGQAARIAGSRNVANPGCYPTGAIALLRPLIDAGLVPRDYPITVNAVSGYSGGGRSLIEAHEASGGPAFELYALGLGHKHVPELVRYAGLTRRPIFVPSVAHIRQGMLVSIPLHLDTIPGKPTLGDLHVAIAAHYDALGEGARRVTVAEVETSGTIEMSALNDTDQMELHVFGHPAHAQAVLVARLDNLGKGASGAAVQNIGLMLGLSQPAVRERVDAL